MVSLVGAGPGDKGLLTLKGEKRIKNADVVLFDRFVGEEILDLIPDFAEKINVGKNANDSAHSMPQELINNLLSEKAKQGLNVVRLKGGDPFVFGRGGEELDILIKNNIPFEVIPGVTSATAGAAYAGIPITHRGIASSFHVITGHGKNNEPVNIDYDSLVKTGGTLIFMMSVAIVDEICAGCLAAGMNEDMPAAIVENATLPTQRKFLGTVSALPPLARENAVKSPAIIIIGSVCQLCEKYDWTEADRKFNKKPLFGKRIIIVRTKPEVSALSESLRELGCYVKEIPCAKIIPLPSLKESLEKINEYSWIVFTSSIGVNVFFDYLISSEIDIRNLHSLKIACVGSETEKELGKRGIKANFRPKEYSGNALAHGLSERAEKNEKLLIVRAKDGSEDLTQILASKNIDFDDVAIYQKERKAVIIEDYNFDYAAFTSSSAVEWFIESVKVDFTKVKAVCIGERTAATAKSHGMEIYISEEATIQSMTQKFKAVAASEELYAI